MDMTLSVLQFCGLSPLIHHKVCLFTLQLLSLCSYLPQAPPAQRAVPLLHQMSPGWMTLHRCRPVYTLWALSWKTHQWYLFQMQTTEFKSGWGIWNWDLPHPICRVSVTLWASLSPSLPSLHRFILVARVIWKQPVYSNSSSSHRPWGELWGRKGSR